MVISLVAKGLTTGEVQAHLAEVYGAEVSRETISDDHRPGAGGPGGVAEPAAGPGVRGAVHRRDQRQDPRRQRGQPAHLRGAGRHRRRRAGHPRVVGRGARRRRGRQVLAAGADRDQEPRHRTTCSWWSATASRACRMRSARSGPRPSPRPASCTCCGTASVTPAAATGLPSPRTSSRSTPPRPRPRRWTRSPSSAAPGRRSYPAIVKLWENAWAEFVPFLGFDQEIRTLICTTNAIESLNARFRRSVKARGHFPTEQAALKHLYLVIISLDPTGRGTAALVQPVEGRPERLRHHLRRPPQRRQEVNTENQLHL